MEKIAIMPFRSEWEELIAFLTNEKWPFHSIPDYTQDYIQKEYTGGDRELFWIQLDEKKVGLLTINDRSDSIPLFDLRTASSVRGQGIGTYALQWLADYLFALPEPKLRIEAYTRSDNLAMRKALTKSGFVKEGYLRSAWENGDGSVCDALCYARIFSDWKNNTTTPIALNDFPF